MDSVIDISAADQSSASTGVPIKEELANGDYILVAVDIDTTGRRLIDEVRAGSTNLMVIESNLNLFPNGRLSNWQLILRPIISSNTLCRI